MTNDSTIPKPLVEWGVCLSVAFLLGYVLAKPLSTKSIAVVGLVMAVIFFPLMLRWHHRLLIVTWNAFLVVFFLPGDLGIGLIMAVVSLGFSLLQRSLRKHERGLFQPSVAIPLLVLAFVILATAVYTGGIQSRSMGSDQWGAKRYLGVFAAIMGYFAMSSQALPRHKARFYAVLFFASGMLALISDLIYFAGPTFYVLYNFFPSSIAYAQASTEGVIGRLAGASFFGLALYSTMMARYGVKGLLDFHKWWRLVVFLGALGAGLLGGYRSVAIIMVIYFIVQFILEGLWKTRLMPIMAVLGVGAFLLILSFFPALPVAAQRSLSFVQYVYPDVDIDPMAKRDAAGTLEWRLEMWRVVWKDVPDYLWMGKGFTYSGTDFQLMQESQRRGFFSSYEDTLISGNYHNGFLTLIIPFGVWGVAAFLWFCIAGARVLYLNWRNSPPELKTVNTFLFGFFLSRLLFYFSLYGQFDIDLFMFTGVVGLSISLNGGLLRHPETQEIKRETVVDAETAERPALVPA